MGRVVDVDHVQFAVPVGSLPQAREFYEGVLGLRELRHPSLDKPGTLRYPLGAQRLDLSEGVTVRHTPQSHLALRYHGVLSLAKELRARGVPVDGPDELPSIDGGAPFARIYTEDPFGHRLELIEARIQEPADAAHLDRTR